MTEPRPGKASRRLRRLAVMAGLLGIVAAVRRTLLDRDRRAFLDRYGPGSDGSGPR